MGQAHVLFRLLWGPSAQGRVVCVPLLISLGCNPSSVNIFPVGHRFFGCSSPPLSLQGPLRSHAWIPFSWAVFFLRFSWSLYPTHLPLSISF